MTLDIPGATPETIPVVLPAAATTERLLDQIPPGVLLLSVVVEPAQTSGLPEMTAGSGFTVIVVLTAHPEIE